MLECNLLSSEIQRGKKSKAPLRLGQAISAWTLGPHHLLGLRSLDTCNLGQGENIGGKKKKSTWGQDLIHLIDLIKPPPTLQLVSISHTAATIPLNIYNT